MLNYFQSLLQRTLGVIWYQDVLSSGSLTITLLLLQSFAHIWKLRTFGYQREVGRWVTSNALVHSSTFQVEFERWPISFTILWTRSKGLQTLLTTLRSHEIMKRGGRREMRRRLTQSRKRADSPIYWKNKKVRFNKTVSELSLFHFKDVNFLLTCSFFFYIYMWYLSVLCHIYMFCV